MADHPLKIIQKAPNQDHNDPWYKEGLSFQCTECGKCCSGKDGYVWLNDQDIEAMAAHLGLSREAFLEKYTRKFYRKIVLKDLNDEGDCIFLKDKKCHIYKARPLQCRTFPFWEENLESKEAWQKAGLRCEGVNHKNAKKVSFEEIQKNKIAKKNG